MFCGVDRLINRRQQGDLGEASAIEWLTRQGATVSAPLGHSPDYDLIAEIDDRLLRVQVKTSTCLELTLHREERWSVSISTNGGNQSWSGLTKRFDPAKADALFVLVGDGRRWLIPAAVVEGTHGVRLGGRRYSEFEIEQGAPIVPLVYGSEPTDSRIRHPTRGSAGVGEPGRAVNPVPRLLSGFESLLPHAPRPGAKFKGERALGRSGQAIIREKRQMTLPAKPFSEAGLQIGDRLRFRADGDGRVVIERIEDT
jgi:Holliday junction resolvase-like predicted endonuclease